MNDNRRNSVSLRALEPEDLPLLYDIENDSSLWQVGCNNVPYSKYALNNYLLTSSNDIYADRQVRLVIQRDDGTAVGLLDIFRFDPKHDRAEVGIAVKRQFCGMGYGRRAVEEVLKYARDVLALHQLYAIVDVENHASAEMFDACGFHVTATLKQWVRHRNTYHDAMVMQIFL